MASFAAVLSRLMRRPSYLSLLQWLSGLSFLTLVDYLLFGLANKDNPAYPLVHPRTALNPASTLKPLAPL